MKMVRWAFLSLFLLAVTGLANLQGESGLEVPIAVISWSPDGSQFALAGGDSGCGEGEIPTVAVYVFGIDRTLRNTLQGNQCRVISIGWSPDGEKIAASGIDPFAKVWDVATGNLITTTVFASIGNGELVWSPDGTKIVNAPAESFAFNIWDAATGETLAIFGFDPKYQRNKVYSVDWSPDGAFVVSGGVLGYDNPEGFIRIWDAVTTELVQEFEHPGVVTSVVWKPDGTQIAAGSGNNEIRIWDAQTGDLIRTIQGNAFKLEWHPFENLIAGGDAASANVWNTETGELIQSFASEGEFGAPSVDWSPYGGRLIYNAKHSITIGGNQTRAFDDAIRIVTPDPSLENVSAIAEQCVSNAENPLPRNNILQAEAVSTLEIADLPAFIQQVQALPADAIPAACAADLIAVAEAVAAQ